VRTYRSWFGILKADFAFVFPGQGSQKIGMLVHLGQCSPVIRSTFSQASSILGYDMWALIQDGSQDEINLTEKAQPIFVNGQCGAVASLE